jgi:hypothetical protein
MELRGQAPDSGGANANGSTCNILHGLGIEFRAPRPSIPPTPFFPGIAAAGSQIPFLFPQSSMPPIPGVGIAPPVKGGIGASVEFTIGSQKRSAQESAIEQSKSAKKRRAPRKIIEIVELDDTKDDVEVLKHAGHWKDHWIIQLISVCGEMNHTFSAPPKQGIVCVFF